MTWVRSLYPPSGAVGKQLRGICLGGMGSLATATTSVSLPPWGHYADHLAGATVAIAIVTPDADGHYNNSVMWDAGRASQNMVLAAWDLGIGSVPATVYDHALASRLLGLPGDRRCDFLLRFGHPADPAKLTAPNRAGGRVQLAELVHVERW